MFDPTTFTGFHTWLSLIALASGFVVMVGLMRSERLDGWALVFLATAVLTSATGFAFPFDTVLPSHIVGAISLVVLAVAILARYVFHLAGAWRWAYVVTAMLALYLDAFVGVVQLFRKIPALHAMAPTESEPPFALAQGLLLVVVIVVTVCAVRAFRPAAPTPTGGIKPA